MTRTHKIRPAVMALAIASTVLAACDSDNNRAAPPTPPPPPPPPTMTTFEVSVSNLTNAQPLSPIAVVAHSAGFEAFSVGMPASAGLEELAEGGDPAAFIAEADAATEVIATASGTGPIPPGSGETISFEIEETLVDGLELTVMTMLVNTNDAFSGTNALGISDLDVGESMQVRGIAYDAGTEDDTEAATDIPGPAGNGEGFNAARDDGADAVTMHPGVVTRDDGFAASDLTQDHRFDNPVLQVVVTRTL